MSSDRGFEQWCVRLLTFFFLLSSFPSHHLPPRSLITSPRCPLLIAQILSTRFYSNCLPACATGTDRQMANVFFLPLSCLLTLIFWRGSEGAQRDLFSFFLVKGLGEIDSVFYLLCPLSISALLPPTKGLD